MSEIKRRSVLAGAGAGAVALGSSMSIREARAQAAAASAPIKIGCMAPFSGVYTVVGTPIKVAAGIAVDQINAAGGVNGRKLELVIGDEKADPNQSVAVARDFMSQGLQLVIGEPNTANLLATLPVIKEGNALMIACGTPDERLTHEAFIPNLFTTAPNNYMALSGWAKIFAQRYPNITTWGGIIPDISMSHNIWDVFAVLLPRAYAAVGKKITLLDPQLAKFGTTDFKTQIANLLSGPAEAMMSVEVGNDGLTFFQQQRQLGLDKKMKLMADYSLDIDLPRALKKNLPPVIWSKSYFSYPAWEKNKMAVETNAAFVKATGDQYLHQLGCCGHTAVLSIAAALKANGGKTDLASMIPALEGRKFDSIRGQTYYRKEDHQLVSFTNFCRFEGADTPAGWKYAEILTVDESQNLHPPTPGVKFVVPG